MARTRKQTDWEAMRLQFIIDPEQPNLKQFCGKHDLSYSTASKRSSQEDWENLRQLHWAKVQTKATEHIADFQATVAARDTSQKLSEIQAMKAVALKYAGGTEGYSVAYEKPADAVAAYERLEKLERLILGESTEHVKVDDAREFARQVLTIVREEVMDRDTLERIAARLTSVGSGLSSGTADRALN